MIVATTGQVGTTIPTVCPVVAVRSRIRVRFLPSGLLSFGRRPRKRISPAVRVGQIFRPALHGGAGDRDRLVLLLLQQTGSLCWKSVQLYPAVLQLCQRP